MQPTNYYSKIPKKLVEKKQNYKNFSKVKIEVPCFGLIIGATSAGKTNTLLYLVEQIGAWNKIFWFTKQPSEPLYKFLTHCISKVENKHKVKVLTVSNDINEIPNLDSIEKSDSNLFIFDDMVCEEKNLLERVAQLFIRGRKMNCSAFFITQSYFKTPTLIRSQCNLLIFKRINSTRDLRRVLAEHQMDLDLETLQKMYKYSTQKKEDFFMIDLNQNDPKLKYRKNLG